MATPISYHLQRTPGAGTNIFSFSAAADVDAETVAQQIATLLAIKVYLVRTDSGASIGAGLYSPAAQGAALGNSVVGVAYSPY